MVIENNRDCAKKGCCTREKQKRQSETLREWEGWRGSVKVPVTKRVCGADSDYLLYLTWMWNLVQIESTLVQVRRIQLFVTCIPRGYKPNASDVLLLHDMLLQLYQIFMVTTEWYLNSNSSRTLWFAWLLKKKLCLNSCSIRIAVHYYLTHTQ